MDEKKSLKIGEGKPGPGRPKGVPNKTTKLIRDAIIQAATDAGGPAGMVGYLTKQAKDNPGPFMSLLGKVLPTQIEGGDKPIQVEAIARDAAEFTRRISGLATRGGEEGGASEAE